MRWRLCGWNVRVSPSFVYLPIRGPRLKSTPSVKAPATPWTTPEAIESWKPKRSVEPAAGAPAPGGVEDPHDGAEQDREHAGRPRAATRSMSAPDMIDAVVHENSRNARKKIR